MIKRHFLFFCSILLSFQAVKAQSPYRIELIKQEIVTSTNHFKDTSFVAVPSNGGVYADSELYFIQFIANPEKLGKTWYFTLFDIQPDGIINELQPARNAEVNYKISANTPDSLVIWDLPLLFSPPFGKESILVLFTEQPITYSRFPGRGAGMLYEDDIRWIQQGFWPEFIKGTKAYTGFNFEILPKIKAKPDFDGDGVTDNFDKCPQVFGKSSNFGCPEIEAPLKKSKKSKKKITKSKRGIRGNKVYSPPPPPPPPINKNEGAVLNRFEVPEAKKYMVYPIVNFTEPAEPSYTDENARGTNLKVKAAKYKAFVVKGTINCLKPIVAMEIMVSDTAGKVRSYVETTFEKISDGIRFSLQIELSAGKNLIDVVVKTDEGYGVRQKLEMEYLPTEELLPRKDYLVVMAVNEYQTWNKLKNPIRDAEAISAQFVNHYGFDPANVIKLYDQDFTLQKVGEVFRELLLKVGENDRIVVYYAGHGYFDELEGEGYWIPVDGGEVTQTHTFIPNSKINMYISRLKTKHTLFIADACFSGSYLVKETRGATPFTTLVDKPRSRWMFSSGRMEVVQDEYLNTGHSPFAWFLLNYLQTPPQTTFPASVMTNAVTISVSNNSSQAPMARPIREAGDEGGEFVFEYR